MTQIQLWSGILVACNVRLALRLAFSYFVLHLIKCMRMSKPQFNIVYSPQVGSSRRSQVLSTQHLTQTQYGSILLPKVLALVWQRFSQHADYSPIHKHLAAPA
jgi:hypothetical protein